MRAHRPNCPRIDRVITSYSIHYTKLYDTFVTDDSLVQCIADIRRALGDDGHKVVETFPKRGYRLNVNPPDATAPTASGNAGSRNRPIRRSISYNFV